jgi:hypothetical protein
MAHGIRGAARKVMRVKVGLLRDTSPFRIEQGQRRKAIGIRDLEYSVILGEYASEGETSTLEEERNNDERDRKIGAYC